MRDPIHRSSHGGFGVNLSQPAGRSVCLRILVVYVSLTHIPLRNVENHDFSCETVSRRLTSENRLTGTANDGRGSDST
jgi:hypothetical protein